MLTVFNRTELITALSAEQLLCIKGALTQAGIPHHSAALNRGGLFPTRQRGLFFDTNHLVQYRVYVHRDDYDLARRAIQPALEKR